MRPVRGDLGQEAPDKPAEQHELHGGLNTLGRNPTNEFRIPDASVSSFHAEITLLEGGLGLPGPARRLGDALEQTLREGCRTADLGGEVGCSEFGARVRQILEQNFAEQVEVGALIANDRGRFA